VHPEDIRPEPRIMPPAPPQSLAHTAPKRTPIEPAAVVAPPKSPTTIPLAAPPAAAPFDYQPEPTMFQSAAPEPGRSPKKMVIAAVMLTAVLGGGYMVATRLFSGPAADAIETGSLAVSTNPPGAQVFVDGEPRGLTPVTLTLEAGDHKVELRGSGEPRTIPVTIAPGTQASQYIELPAGAPVTTAGQLQIRTEPAGARVTVDGAARGTSPMVVPDLTPGEHIVQLDSDLGSVRQVVVIEAGVTASLVVPLGAATGAPVSGWIAVTAPVDVQIFEGGRLLGSNLSDRIMVSAGKHDVEIVNEALGYRENRTLQVSPGKVAPISVEMPKGTLALNALPWAEVWIDGEKIGETPIGNYPLTVGTHDVVFRHPELGEQHHTTTVTLKTPARLSVDLRKK
jgi:PEGA domain-containing protein